MELRISRMLLAQLRVESRASPSAEICGLLFGADDCIASAESCANVAADPARTFELDPAALFAAHRRARAGGPHLIGHYHSHPSGLAVPSAIDAANAMGDGAVWLILAGDEVRAWRTTEPGMLEAVVLASSS